MTPYALVNVTLCLGKKKSMRYPSREIKRRFMAIRISPASSFTPSFEIRFERYFSTVFTLMELLNKEFTNGFSSGFESLTPNEREVLQLIAEGSTNQQISKQMMISVKTVEKYRSNLISKLGVKEQFVDN